MNNQWLRQQALNFLDKPVDHVKYMATIKERNEMLAERGFTHDDFSRMLRTINNERKQAKEALHEAEQPTQGNKVTTVETKHREPVRLLNDDNKRQTNASGGKVRSGESQILKMLDERSKQ